MSARVRQRANLFFLVLMATLGCSGLLAQVDRGAIVGTVSDASGAVVPEASVTITNTATNQGVQVSTNASGYYEAPLLRIGTYTVTMEKEGFRKTVRPGVEVGVNQVVRVDLTLQVGATTQTVEVTGAPPLVQAETSSLGTIETTRRVVDLPLNGRNFIQLAYLGPGANGGQQGSNVSGGVFENERANEALSINGLRVSNNNFLLNGVDNNEFGLGGVVALPPPDAIQEFRTEENAMSAEFGRGGAAVNVAVKSGTNEIHGGLYEFIRNDVLDARNFFDQNQTDLTTGAQIPGTARPPFRRNQFGFFAGGPVRKDKTFIFGDYQGTRIREGLTNLETVPTNGERGGDFSDRLTGVNFSPCGDLSQIPVYDTGTIFNPFTTRNFTCSNGTVVLLRDPLSYNGQVNVIPPNLINAVGQNVVNLYPTATLPGITQNLLLNPSQSNDQDSFDVHFDNRFSDRDQFFVSYSYGSVRSILPGPLGILGGGDCCPSNSKDGNQHAGTGWTHSFNPTLLNDLHGGYFRFRVTGQPLNFGKALGQQLGIPNANRGDPTSSGLPNFDVSGYTGMGDSLWTPEFAVENIYQLADTVTWLRGRHSLKLGVDFRRQQRNFFQVTAPRGWYSFNGQYTQDLTTASGGNGLADLLLGPPNFFEQDALVGEYPTRYWDLAEFIQDDFHATPNLTLNLGLRYEVTSPANGRVGNFDLHRGVVVNSVGPNAVPHAGVEFDKSDWAPRLGLAYSPFGNKHTVVRSAFGVFYSAEANIFDDLGLNPPFLSVDSQSFPSSIVPPASQFVSAGFPATVVFPDPANPSGTVRTNGPTRLMPRIFEWNFNVQQEVRENWVIQVAYVGTHAYRLWNHEASDLNQPLLPLDTNFSDATGNLGRPYFNVLPNLVTILPLDFPQLSVSYNSFQASVNHRFADGFNILAAYTLGKSLGTADGNVAGNIQNAHNIAAEKGAAPPDIRHHLSLSYLYELPVGRGKRFLGSLASAPNVMLGGWQVSGITTLQSGQAYTANLSTDLSNTGTNSYRPDRIHNPYDFSFDTASAQSIDPLCGSGKQTLACFFNPSAFRPAPLAPGQLSAHVFGNGGNGNLRGPELVNFDVAMLKEFRVTERHRLQFRAEFFNIANTPNFALPGGTVDVAGGAAVTSTLSDNQREIQFALKWTF
ncbi:MAG: hypothetical protein DMG27_00050 [Acidobacteria bacterium]|nr:MAG: hypothetical protein DMG27_00050 [Acidobacteriota bacterium]